MEASLSRALHDLARSLCISLSSLLHGAFALLLARIGGRADVLFGTTVSGRAGGFAFVDSLVGPLMALVPVPVLVPENAPIAGFLQGIHGLLLELMGVEHVPLAELVAASGVASGDAVPFDAILDVARYPGRTLTAGLPAELRIENLDYVTMPHHPLTCFVVPDDTIHLRLVFDRSLFEAEVVAGWLAELALILGDFASRTGALLRAPWG